MQVKTSIYASLTTIQNKIDRHIFNTTRIIKLISEWISTAPYLLYNRAQLKRLGLCKRCL